MLVLSLAPSKRIWLLLCFYTRCLSATNVKCTCPYMAVQMFALTAQSDCVFGVCLSVCGSSDWLTSEFRMSSSCFSYFPLDHHPLLLSLYIYQAEYYTPLQLGGICKIVLKLKRFHPELTNLCLSFCHRQQIWTCVPLLASLHALYASMSPFNFNLCLVIQLTIFPMERTGASLSAWVESKWGAANIKPAASGKGANTVFWAGTNCCYSMLTSHGVMFAEFNGILWRI